MGKITHKPNMLLCVMLIGSLVSFAGAQTILIEAESFDNRGGWVVDQQFMDQMGSPFLLAHGLGRRVGDAATVEFPGGRHIPYLGANTRLGRAVEGAGQAGPIPTHCRSGAA